MIEAEGLSKRYGDTLAVDNLTFSVAPGKITGFLGPNGAGKTTTMRMILGLDRPTAGRVTVDGKPFDQADQPMRRVGALLDAKAVHGGRSAYNHLLCLAESNNLPRRRVDEVLALVGLAEVARKRSKGFSLAWDSAWGSLPHSSVTRRSSCSTSRSTGGPRRHPVDPQPHEGAGRRGKDHLRVQPPDVGDGEHRRSSAGDRPGEAHRGLHDRGVHRRQLAADGPGPDAAAGSAGKAGYGGRSRVS